MSLIHIRKNSAVLLAAVLSMAGAAQAQNVIVRVPDNAAELRAAIDASMRAAASGQRVGMATGTVNPAAVRSADGTVTQELDAGTLMHSVARIHADGSIERICVSGLQEAQRAALAPAFAKRLTPSSSAAKGSFDVK
jgi:hypothetical protein